MASCLFCGEREDKINTMKELIFDKFLNNSNPYDKNILNKTAYKLSNYLRPRCVLTRSNLNGSDWSIC